MPLHHYAQDMLGYSPIIIHFETGSCLIIASLLISFLLPAQGNGISLVQAIPPGGALVCPCGLLSYDCNATGVAVAWQVGGGDLKFFNSMSQIDTSMQDQLFTYFLIDVLPGSESTFVSNATINSISSKHNGTTFSCSNGDNFEFETILVAEEPEACHGIVSCAISSNPKNRMLSDITVTLNNTGSDVMCVEGYLFMFGNESKYVAGVSSPSTTFTISSNEEGLIYKYQEIITVNAENRTGNGSCGFALKKPRSVTSLHSSQNCQETSLTTALTLQWEVPSLGSDNCIDANQVQWHYIISLTSTTLSLTFTKNDPLLVVEDSFSSNEYNITITPVLTDLRVSGDPLTTSIVLSANCHLPTSTPEEAGNATAIVLGVLLPLVFICCLVFIIAGIISFCAWKKRTMKNCAPAAVPLGSDTLTLEVKALHNPDPISASLPPKSE